MEKSRSLKRSHFVRYFDLYRRIRYTLIVLIIFILGSNIPILQPHQLNDKVNVFNNLGAAAMGGDYTNVNLFSLGLGPWLTALLIINLIGFRNIDKTMKQTKQEKQIKEKSATLFLCVVQGYYVLNLHVKHGPDYIEVMLLSLLMLIAGSMMLIWLADQNAMYGIAGPMPIVMMSIIRSIIAGKGDIDDLSPLFWLIVAVLLMSSVLLLVFIERSEYRIPYVDILNISKVQKNFLAWKLNPAGSLAIMLCLSFYTMIKYVIELVLMFFTDIKMKDFQYLELSHPIGITLFVAILFLLGLFLSKFMLNPKKKAEEFLKSGNYFAGISPGKSTESFLNHQANLISLFSATIMAVIIGIPFYITLLIPQVFNEVYLSVQVLILVYIAINVVEAMRSYLYFQSYRMLLNKYW